LFIFFSDKVHLTRLGFNNYFAKLFNAGVDKLQENLMKELIEAEKQVTTETRELLVSLDEKQKELTEYHTNIVKINRYASELQTFLAVSQIQKDVDTQDKCLQSIVNSDSLNQTKLAYKIDSHGSYSIYLE
jgi:DNA-binding transcriptional regulator GbsR (MarR family)